jgi:hypothetical protein
MRLYYLMISTLVWVGVKFALLPPYVFVAWCLV